MEASTKVEADTYDKIVISNLFVREIDMKPYFNMAEKYGFSVFTLIVENRHGNKNNIWLPGENLDNMENNFEIKLK